MHNSRSLHSKREKTFVDPMVTARGIEILSVYLRWNKTTRVCPLLCEIILEDRQTGL